MSTLLNAVKSRQFGRFAVESAYDANITGAPVKAHHIRQALDWNRDNKWIAEKSSAVLPGIS
jgi:hypothetical protein